MFRGKQLLYWISDNGLKGKIPCIDDRKKLVIEIHDKLNHRGIEAVYYELKKILLDRDEKDH
ncbi:hypothetical protein COBT_002242 [Conglomerata obtusa]